LKKKRKKTSPHKRRREREEGLYLETEAGENPRGGSARKKTIKTIEETRQEALKKGARANGNKEGGALSERQKEKDLLSVERGNESTGIEWGLCAKKRCRKRGGERP